MPAYTDDRPVFDFVEMPPPSDAYLQALKTTIGDIPDEIQRDAALQALGDGDLDIVYSLLGDNGILLPPGN